MSLKWFLVGSIVTLFVGDWIRLRAERAEMDMVASKSVSVADRKTETTRQCIETLEEVKELVHSASLRAEVAAYSRAQALDLFNRARRGDARAIEDLRELGIDPNLPPRTDRPVQTAALAEGQSK